MRVIIISFLFSCLIYAQSNVRSTIIDDNMKVDETSLKSNQIFARGSFLELRAKRSWNSPSSDKLSQINQISIVDYKPQKSSFIDSDLFLVLVGSAVTLGATAAYLKLESDDNYEKYMATNDKKYLRRTDDLDLYSGIALGALELNFGYLIYKFLTD